jgi:uncharacterized protein involved in exopolysaccharide biosynthesis
MNQAAPLTNLENADEITLVDVARKLRARWLIIAAFMVICSAAGLLTLHLVTYTYAAVLKITPVQSTAQTSPSLRQLTGLASLAGLSVPSGQEGTLFFLYVESVTSRAVADELAKNPNIMKVVFKDEWNGEADHFEKKVGRYDPWIDKAKELIGIPSYPWAPPDGARLQVYLQDNLDILEDTKKPLVTISYDHQDPAFAVSLLTALNHTIDDLLRKKTLTRVNENIAYLSQQLSTTTLNEQRQAIIEALNEQVKLRMAANSNAPVAAEIVSGPTSSYRPTKPRPELILAGAVFGGLFLGIIAALAWGWLRSSKETKSDAGVFRSRSPEVRARRELEAEEAAR